MTTPVRKAAEAVLSETNRPYLRHGLHFFAGLTFAVLIVGLPLWLAVWPQSTQGLLQFLGAMFGAGITLAGVIVAALYNAELTRERDDREATRKLAAIARAAVMELDAALALLIVQRTHLTERLATSSAKEEFVDLVLTMWPAMELPRVETIESRKLELCEMSPDIAGYIGRFLVVRNDTAASVRMLQDARNNPTLMDEGLEPIKQRLKIFGLQLDNLILFGRNASQSLMHFLAD